MFPYKVGWLDENFATECYGRNDARVGMLEATAIFNPEIWLIAWAEIAGSQTITATVSGVDFSGLITSSIRLNGSVTPVSSTIVNSELQLLFNRHEAVASSQTQPLPGRFSQTIQGQVPGRLLHRPGRCAFR